IEQAFRDLKSHGWQVKASLRDDPDRMARWWILLMVAYGWMRLLCGAALKRRADGVYVRRWSLFREGRQAFLATSPLS
nr:hypothetical protein [Anaerolineae bacterium]